VLPVAAAGGVRVAKAAGAAIGRRAATVAATLGGSVASASGAVVAGGVVAAFAVGYAIGKGLLALWKFLSVDERNFRKAMAFRHARQEWEAQHGRPMTATEVREMGRGFLQSIGRG
jgi:hypothetical protein